MAAAHITDLNGLKCVVCSRLLVPPIYHCHMNHVICRYCYELGPGNCDVANCNRQIYECKLSTSIFTRVLLACPNKPGCNMTMPITDYRDHRCPDFTCPLPSCGHFALIDHLLAHPDLKVVPNGKEFGFKVSRGSSYLLKEHGESGEFFLLQLGIDTVYLENMWFAPPRKCTVFLGLPGNHRSGWHYLGPTSSSMPCLPLLQPPVHPGNNETFSVRIHFLKRESDISPTLATIMNIEDVTCSCCLKIAVPPLYHCSFNHPICGVCISKIPNNQLCLYCRDDASRLFHCALVSNLLVNSKCVCQSKGCPLNFWPIFEIEEHLDECREFSHFCPLCLHSITPVKAHLARHPVKEFKFDEFTSCSIVQGYNLLYEKASDTFYFLLFEGQMLCLQHLFSSTKKWYMFWYDSEDLEDKYRWCFMGETVTAEQPRRINMRCLRIPIPRGYMLPITIHFTILSEEKHP